jgi:hypothetical protein
MSVTLIGSLLLLVSFFVAVDRITVWMSQPQGAIISASLGPVFLGSIGMLSQGEIRPASGLTVIGMSFSFVLYSHFKKSLFHKAPRAVGAETPEERPEPEFQVPFLPASPPAPSEAEVTDLASQILVTQEAVRDADSEPAKLVMNVVDYVNAVAEHITDWTTLPVNARRAYHADFFIDVVAGGNPQQFMEHGHLVPNMLTEAEEGLVAMDAHAHLEIFQDLSRFAKHHLDDEGQLSASANLKEGSLDALIGRLIEVERSTPLAALSARWLRSLPELDTRPEEEWRTLLRLKEQHHENADQRNALQRIVAIENMLLDPVILGIGMAAIAIDPNEHLIRVGSGRAGDPDSDVRSSWLVRTTGGLRIGLVREAAVELYQRLDDPGGLTQDAPDPPSARIGPQLSQVAGRDIGVAQDYAEELDAAAAIDLVLHTLDPEANFVHLTVAECRRDRTHGMQLACTVIVGLEVLAIVVSEGEAFAKHLDDDDRAEVRVTRKQIDAHALVPLLGNVPSP